MRTHFDHERLKVYGRALDIYDWLSRYLDTLPPGHARLVDQLDRAAMSVALNIAEGAGRSTMPEKRRFYVIARGSATECAAVLDLLRQRKLLTIEQQAEPREGLLEIVSMLTGLIRSTGESESGG